MTRSTTLLVIDDDLRSCQYLSDVLLHLGYRASFAHSWKSAINALEQNRFDIIMLDETLAHRQGEYLIAGLREHGHEQPVIIMSPMADYLLRDWTGLGAESIIGKPASPSRLKETLRCAATHAAK
ncbi:response regulator [bacterium]|nr:response regulator [bacterium]